MKYSENNEGEGLCLVSNFIEGNHSQPARPSTPFSGSLNSLRKCPSQNTNP